MIYQVEVNEYSTCWRLNNKYHRDGDLPAIEYINGAKVWYQYGKQHRDGDMPAYENVDGYKSWWQHGERHRVAGPAVEYVDGEVEYWLDGELVTKEEHQRRTQPSELIKEMTMAQLEAQLGHKIKIVGDH